MWNIFSKIFSVALIGFASTSICFAADSNLGESSEIKFCKGMAAPYANCLASELRKQADALASPVAIFEYVKNNYDYSLYYGAQSGAINTFLGGRGNDVDLAATLIAMLRSQGIPARYAVGTAIVNLGDVQSWLQVDGSATTLPMTLMKNQGIQKVQYTDSSNDVLKFEHVWVEALVPYTQYRGAGKQTTDCSVSSPSTECHWIQLDPSYKKYKFAYGALNTSPLDPYKALNLETNFPYVAGSSTSFLNNYYNAIKNGNELYRDKNPLEIYQEQILTWLRTNSPGSSLNDIPDYVGIAPEITGLLPASLPFTTSGSVNKYNSVADHDAVVPSSELKAWGLRLNVQIQVACGTSLCESAPKYFLMTDLAVQKPAIVAQASTNNLVLRLGGVDNVIITPSDFYALTKNTTYLTSNTSFTIVLTADGAPATDTTTSFTDVMDCDGTTHKVGAAGPGYTDELTKACYRATFGSYYVVAVGGETSNWSQVHRAAKDLLAVTQSYAIVFNPNQSNSSGKCTAANSAGCTPYLDSNSSGAWDSADKRLIDSPVAMDDMTGGVLYAAAMQYFAQLRDHIANLDRLNKIKSPITGFMGLVSSGSNPNYIGDTAYSIRPDGLIIDIKGMNVHGCWRIDGSGTSNAHCDFIGHMASSLEHETWQALTGYDAISTVRGIQIALKDPSTALLDVTKSSTVDTVQSMYSGFGYTSAPSSNFIYHDKQIAFPSTWGLPSRVYNFSAWSDPKPGSPDTDTTTYQNYDGTQCFSMIKKLPASQADTHLGWMWYQNDMWWLGLGALGFDIAHWTNLEQTKGLNYAFTTTIYDSFNNQIPAGQTVQYAINQTYNYMKNVLFRQADNGSGLPYSFVDYFDKNVGPQNFNQADFVYRTSACPGVASSNQPAQRIQQVRDFLLWQDLSKTWSEAIIPTKKTVGGGFDFTVSVQKVYDKTSGRILTDTLDIANAKGVFSGGGFVAAPVLDDALESAK